MVDPLRVLCTCTAAPPCPRPWRRLLWRCGIGLAPANVRVERFVPQADLLGRATASSLMAAPARCSATRRTAGRTLVPLFADHGRTASPSMSPAADRPRADRCGMEALEQALVTLLTGCRIVTPPFGSPAKSLRCPQRRSATRSRSSRPITSPDRRGDTTRQRSSFGCTRRPLASRPARFWCRSESRDLRHIERISHRVQQTLGWAATQAGRPIFWRMWSSTSRCEWVGLNRMTSASSSTRTLCPGGQ